MEKIVPKKTEKCIICNQIITPDDIRYNNYEIVVNKRDKKIKYFHANCFRNLTNVEKCSTIKKIGEGVLKNE